MNEPHAGRSFPAAAPTGVVAVEAAAVPARARVSTCPEPFAARVAGRRKRLLGDLFGLRNFGVGLKRLGPGAAASLRHRHSRRDEFVYVVEGEPVLVTDAGRETPLRPGMCAGFSAAEPRTTGRTGSGGTCSSSRSATAPRATRWSAPRTTCGWCGTCGRAVGASPTRRRRPAEPRAPRAWPAPSGSRNALSGGVGCSARRFARSLGAPARSAARSRHAAGLK